MHSNQIQPPISTSATANGAPVANGWQPDEKLIPARPGSEIGPSRRGTTPDGWIYTYYSDGSGSVEPTAEAVMEGWSIGCHNDAMTDKRKCQIRSSNARLSISYINSKSPSSVCIIGHDYPGRFGAIRIDEASPIATNQYGCLPGGMAAKIAKAKTFTTRHVEWPYDENLDKKSESTGLGAAMELLAHMEANRGKLTF